MTIATNHPDFGHFGHIAPFEFELYGGLANIYTDADSITDGQEINCYEVTWMEPMDDGPVLWYPELILHLN